MTKIYLYKRFERFWHWSQAALIIFLAITGFEVHGSFSLFGFEKAVVFHRVASYAFLILIGLAIFWHFTTGEWKQYLPTTRNIKKQVNYYTMGIFKGEAHPAMNKKVRKLNPLQVLVYLGFKLLIVPVMVVSGLMYMFYKYIDINDVVVISGFELRTIAVIHTFGAFLLVAFLIVHVYMTTTGEHVTTNIKAMLTGYEEVEHEEGKVQSEEEVTVSEI